MVREWKSANFSPSASSCLRSLGDQPVVEVVGAVVAVQRGPLVLDAFDGPEQLGTAEAGKFAFRHAKSFLPSQKLVDVIGADPMGDDDSHQRISRTVAAADHLLGARAVEIRPALLEKFLPGRSC